MVDPLSIGDIKFELGPGTFILIMRLFLYSIFLW